MEDGNYLFNMEDLPTKEAALKFNHIDIPLWTKNKALFIARYLKTFTFVTKHGTYLDAFAGPQHEGSRDSSWAAKLVLENEPAWLRKFHFFDLKRTQVKHLKNLKKSYFDINPRLAKKRLIEIHQGDCNNVLPQFLKENPISDKEATFCLLDQRSTECDWETVRQVAKHKSRPGVNKIEIFYFFAQGWIDRTLKSWRNDVKERHIKWWGRDDVLDFLKLSSHGRGIHLAERFKEEFGYKYCYPFPIQKEGEKGAIMFWMIHASDHRRAPSLMHSAYRHVGAGGGLNDPSVQRVMPF